MPRLRSNERPTMIDKIIKKKSSSRSLYKKRQLLSLSLRSLVFYTMHKPKSARRRLFAAKIPMLCLNCDTYKCKNCSRFQLLEDPTTAVPKSLIIKYCELCQSYSYTGRSYWFKIPLESSSLLIFLLKRLSFHFWRLNLTLINAWITPTEPHNPKIIKLSLKLQFKASSDGSSQEKICTVDYKLASQNCPSCLLSTDETHLSSVVQLRQHGPCNQTLRWLQLSVLSNQTSFGIQKIKQTIHGADFYVSNDSEAMALYQFFCSSAPVKPDQMVERTYPDSWIKSMSSQSYISALICPICCQDLVYLPSKVLATLGVKDIGPLVICTDISSSIRVLDPFKLKECEINSNSYWNDPFEPLKTTWDLVKYEVFGVEIVSSGPLYSLADVQVARVSDFGKEDTVFLVRTHLGNVLKTGDYALGYDLGKGNFTDMQIEFCTEMLPDVVLIKKEAEEAEQPNKFPEKKISAEYEHFLRDLEKNPEDWFKLSLNDRDEGKKSSEHASLEKPEDLGLDLEDLLADLALNDNRQR